jgi:hypothetical protein
MSSKFFLPPLHFLHPTARKSILPSLCTYTRAVKLISNPLQNRSENVQKMASLPKFPPPATQPSPPLLTHPLKLLVALRLAFGVSAFLLPSFSSDLFSFPLLPSATILMRMVGARDAVVALLLFNSKSIEDRDKSLFAGVAVDSMDAIATAISWYSGNLDTVQAAGVAGAAGVLIALAKLGLWRK